MTKLHMIGETRVGANEYYYAIEEMQIRGSCFCYGHASECIKINGIQYDKDDIDNSNMVFSQCKCEHFTMGENCEKCLPLYNDRPWRPGIGAQPNECKKCDCNSHASSCTFNQDLWEASGRVTGGVCDNCQHNTYGINCERCKPNFYHDKSLPFYHPNACKPCKCHPVGTISYNVEAYVCQDSTCKCKAFVTGESCDTCENGYWNLSLDNGEDGCLSINNLILNYRKNF